LIFFFCFFFLFLTFPSRLSLDKKGSKFKKSHSAREANTLAPVSPPLVLSNSFRESTRNRNNSVQTSPNERVSTKHSRRTQSLSPPSSANIKTIDIKDGEKESEEEGKGGDKLKPLKIQMIKSPSASKKRTGSFVQKPIGEIRVHIRTPGQEKESQNLPRTTKQKRSMSLSSVSGPNPHIKEENNHKKEEEEEKEKERQNHKRYPSFYHFSNILIRNSISRLKSLPSGQASMEGAIEEAKEKLRLKIHKRHSKNRFHSPLTFSQTCKEQPEKVRWKEIKKKVLLRTPFKYFHHLIFFFFYSLGC